jgi:hypothetical protein
MIPKNRPKIITHITARTFTTLIYLVMSCAVSFSLCLFLHPTTREFSEKGTKDTHSDAG